MDLKDYIASGVIESYVLGVANPAEVAEIEQLKDQYPEVQKAIDEFAISLEEIAFKNAVAPPADVKDKLLLKLADDFESNKGNPLKVAYNSFDNQKNTDTLQKIRGWRYAAAASIILLVASAVTNIYLYNRYRDSDFQYQALLTERNSLQARNEIFQSKVKEYQTASEMLYDPNFEKVRMLDPNKKTDFVTTAFWNKNTKEVFITVNKLPNAGTGKQYQLWALVDGKPVDAGMIEENCTTICQMKNIPRAQAFAITLEQTGGSPSPTMEQLFVLGTI